MNITETRVAEADRRLTALKTQHRAVQAELEAARGRLGTAFAEVADGAPVPAEQHQALSALVASEMTLAAMVKAAEAALREAGDVAFARGIDANAALMRSLLQEHERLSRNADAAVQALAVAGTEMRNNAAKIIQTFRALRGRNTLTSAGNVTLDLADLAQGRQVQWLAEQALGYFTTWWAAPSRRPFLPGALGATAAIHSAFDELMGLRDLKPGSLKEARADMAADGLPVVLEPVSADDLDLSDVSDFAV